jgi:hypothetical protein
VIHSLRIRLLISFLAVILITVGTVSFFVARSSWNQIRQYEERTGDMRENRAATLISSYYTANGNWDRLQDLVVTLAAMEQRRIIVTDPNDIVIADSENSLQGEEYHQDKKGIQLFKRNFVMTPHGQTNRDSLCQSSHFYRCHFDPVY